jgi:hypothetical protein
VSYANPSTGRPTLEEGASSCSHGVRRVRILGTTRPMSSREQRRQHASTRRLRRLSRGLQTRESSAPGALRGVGIGDKRAKTARLDEASY